VDYTGSEGSQALPKVVAERQAGKYLVDVHIGGPTSPIRSLQPLGALDPLEPALVLPEVKDTALWLKNQFWFMDNAGQYILCFAGAAANPTSITYNTTQVDPKELTSWYDLLQPKWKGKVASADPNIQGTMRGNLTVLAAIPQLGTDYIRQLYAPEQEVRLSGDSRLLLDWIAQGQYAIGLGIGRVDVEEASRLGLPVAWKDLKESMAELSAQFNTIMLVNQAPHPNAARVYINWVLSREGQIAYQKAIETPSLRLDVAREGVRPEEIPDPAVQYEVTQHERYLPLRDSVQTLVKELAAAR
jgi:iron(III) transport system substrate-binding protein